FIVGRKGIPRRILSRRMVQQIFKYFLIADPMLTFYYIIERKLPVFLRVFHAFKKAVPLFFKRHIKKELHYGETIFPHIAFNIRNLAITDCPNILVNQFVRKRCLSEQVMDPWCNHFFVIGSVQDTYLPSRWHAFLETP